MMKILSCTGDESLARVMTASFDEKQTKLVEFVDAKDPDLPLSKKWVIIISTQFGCPIGCKMCDSGHSFLGNLSVHQLFNQIDYAVSLHQDHNKIDSEKFKIQFARMGEPALNANVLHVLKELPNRYQAPGLIPCITTTAPKNSDAWFFELLKIKKEIYSSHIFQLQISVNTTDERLRDELMPYPKWDFRTISDYGEMFVRPGDRKIALNFALTKDIPVETSVIEKYFNPEIFCIKITPLNPTIESEHQNLTSAFDPSNPVMANELCDKFSQLGYETILSIGDTRENEIGSNCGMSVRTRNLKLETRN